MSYLLTGIVFFLIFSVLILVHELGHFVMAKRAGIKVEEFGFGLPPRLWGKKKGETIYSINWIPFGGFVRMLGEDSLDKKNIDNKRSFAAQSPRNRIKVIVAGVVMNFLLAWMLMFVGFAVGMQPLLGPDDIFNAVSEGVVQLEEGVQVKTDKAGLKSGDFVIGVDGSFDLSNFAGLKSDGKNHDLLVQREGQAIEVKAQALDFEAGNYVSFPRVKIFELSASSSAYKFGLRAGDIVLRVNGQEIYDLKGFEDAVRGQKNLEYDVVRGGLEQKVIVEALVGKRVIISEVLPGSRAEKAGILKEDVILSLNGKAISESQMFMDLMKAVEGEGVALGVLRGGENILVEVEPEDGRIGVYLSELMSYGDEAEFSLYNVNLVSTITTIEDEQYPVHQAFYKGFTESVRLSVLTADMFVSMVKNLVSSGEVPESVAGPVGIAQMTHGFVQEGVVPVLRFVAMLSLSLAVINILPFPALDGGRLLFVLIEVVLGRRVSPKFESLVHLLGYGLIMLLIIAVTYSDILRLIGS